METALNELPLAIFTTLAPMGAGAFAVLAAAFCTMKLDDVKIKAIDRFSLIPLGLIAVGFIASFFHLASPLKAYGVLSGIGHSPLSNEIAVGMVFFVAAIVYVALGLAGKLSASARKPFVLVVAVLALVFSLYLLAQKETLLAQSKRLLRRSLPQKAADRLLRLLSLSNNAFSSFVTGQVTEAFILGTLCCLGMLILRLPYALPVSVIIATLSLIPIFGAWIGAATGAFLIVFQSPIKALTFLIFLLILQQVEGNLIYPKVVGKSVGLPGLWVLAAVTLGGGAFGVLGMLLGVPVCSIVYSLVQEFIRGKPAEESAK